MPARLGFALPRNRLHPLRKALVQAAGFNHGDLGDGFLFPFAQQRGNRHGVARLHPIFAPEFDRVHADLVRNFVHVVFQAEERLRRAVAAIGAGHGQVCVGHDAVELPVGAVVAAQPAQAR
jgi:hypothetical protein